MRRGTKDTSERQERERGTGENERAERQKNEKSKEQKRERERAREIVPLCVIGGGFVSSSPRMLSVIVVLSSKTMRMKQPFCFCGAMPSKGPI